MATLSQEQFQAEVDRIKQIRSHPDYVPEFPPSRLIDDSPEGCVAAFHRVVNKIENANRKF